MIRVVIPTALRAKVLHLLHEGHWRATRMKRMARRYAWWPDVDEDVENIVRNCMICRQSAKATAAQFKSWPQSANPWERIHVDYASPFFGKMWLICVNSFSKYPDVTTLNVGQTTSNHTVDALQQIFSFAGLPNTIVTDNGPQFVSTVFENFCANLNIKHLTSRIFHPACNGEADRFVLTRSVEKNVQMGKDVWWYRI